jgi:hypothetical protein
MVCHWEDTDVVAQEMYSNVSHLSFVSAHFLITMLDWSGHLDLHMHSSGRFVIPFNLPHTRESYCILEIPSLITTVRNIPLFDTSGRLRG